MAVNAGVDASEADGADYTDNSASHRAADGEPGSGAGISNRHQPYAPEFGRATGGIINRN
jgi:hypothetical protein